MWKEFPQNDRYEVHAEGLVRNKSTGLVLKSSKTAAGYMVNSLSANRLVTGKSNRKQYFVHQLVLLTFVGEPVKGMTGDHINGIRADNRLQNLRWATHKQQRANATRAATNALGLAVLQVSPAGSLIARYESISEASRILKVKRDTICAWIDSQKMLGTDNTKYMLVNETCPSEDKEEWVTIVVDDTPIRVSNMGRVDLKGDQRRITKGSVGTNRYMTVSAGRKHRYVHRLVATAFLPGAEQGKVVHHKDSDRTNNKASNLEWVTLKENSQKSVDEGKLGRYRRQIARCNDDGEMLERYESVTSAAKAMGHDRPQALHTAVRKNMRCGGFRWKLLEKGVQSVPRTSA